MRYVLKVLTRQPLNKIARSDDKARQKLEETTRWQPGEVEGRIFDEWMEGGYFHPEATGTAEENFDRDPAPRT